MPDTPRVLDDLVSPDGIFLDDLSAGPFSGEDDLEAASLAGAPHVIGEPGLTQRHDLSPEGVVLGHAEIGASDLGQAHEIVAGEITTGAADLGAAGVEQEHILQGESLAGAAPDIDQPSMSGESALQAMALSWAAPEAGEPALEQEHSLDSGSLVGAQPHVGEPFASEPGGVSEGSILLDNLLEPGGIVVDGLVGEIQLPDELQALSLEGQPAVLGQPSVLVALSGIVVDNLLEPGGIVLDLLSPDAPPPPVSVHQHEVSLQFRFGVESSQAHSIDGVNAFIASSLVAGAPELGQPVYDQMVPHRHQVEIEFRLGIDAVHQHLVGDALEASDLQGAAPDLGDAAVTQEHALSAAGLTSGAPVLQTANAAQIATMVAEGFSGQPAQFGEPELKQSLVAGSLSLPAPVLQAPAVEQTHEIGAASLTGALPALGTPVCLETDLPDELEPASLVSGAPELYSPAIGQTHNAAAADLVSQPVMSEPELSQRHALATGTLRGEPAVLGQPGSTQNHNAQAASIVAPAAVMGQPLALHVPLISTLEAQGITLAPPALGSPTLWRPVTGDLKEVALLVDRVRLRPAFSGEIRVSPPVGAHRLRLRPAFGGKLRIRPEDQPNGVFDLPAEVPEGTDAMQANGVMLQLPVMGQPRIGPHSHPVELEMEL